MSQFHGVFVDAMLAIASFPLIYYVLACAAAWRFYRGADERV